MSLSAGSNCGGSFQLHQKKTCFFKIRSDTEERFGTGVASCGTGWASTAICSIRHQFHKTSLNFTMLLRLHVRCVLCQFHQVFSPGRALPVASQFDIDQLTQVNQLLCCCQPTDVSNSNDIFLFFLSCGLAGLHYIRENYWVQEYDHLTCGSACMRIFICWHLTGFQLDHASGCWRTVRKTGWEGTFSMRKNGYFFCEEWVILHLLTFQQ